MGFTAAQFSSTNFSFTIAEPGHENIDFQCQQISGLGITLGLTEHNDMGIPRKYPGDSITVNPINLTVILDDRLLALEQILDHMSQIKNMETNMQDPEHTFLGILQLMDNMNHPIMEFQFHSSWFESISDINFNSSDSDNTNITVDVAMNCDYYTYSRIA